MTEIEEIKEDNTWTLESALDVLIVLLYAKGSGPQFGEPIEGITRLDKIMYLLYETNGFQDVINRGYKFQADNYGPFAPELFDDIAALKEERMIDTALGREPKNKIETADEESVEFEVDEKEESDRTSSWKTYNVESYKLTDRGLKIGSLLYKGLTEKQRTQLEEIKKTFGNMNLKSLLHYVYTKYPKMTEKSRIVEKILY